MLGKCSVNISRVRKTFFFFFSPAKLEISKTLLFFSGIIRLPDGFVLKNNTEALVMAPNMLLCRLVEALVQTDTNVTALTPVAIIIAIVRPAKM